MSVGAYIPILPIDPVVLTRGTVSYPEAASLDIKRGTPVVIDSDGRADAAATSFTSVFGIAAEDSHNGTAGEYNLLIWPITQGSRWRVALLEALAQTQLGDTEVGFVKDGTTGYWYASTADGGAQARIVDFVGQPAGMAIGDTKAPVIVVFHTTKLQVT